MIDLYALRDEVRLLREDDQGRPRVHVGGNARVHPNSFIQLDLDPVEEDWHASHKRGHSGSARRLHIWNPPGIVLPHQGTVNEIHDHVFDMKSTVVKGTLIQCLYAFLPEVWYGMERGNRSPGEIPATHERYRAVYQSGASSRLAPTGEKGWLKSMDMYEVKAGRSYIQPAFTLHDTKTLNDGLVVTVMEKTAIHEGDATVICQIGKEPDNDFDRATAAPVELLWEAIERALA